MSYYDPCFGTGFLAKIRWSGYRTLTAWSEASSCPTLGWLKLGSSVSSTPDPVCSDLDWYNTGTGSWVQHRLRLVDVELLMDLHKMQDPGYRPRLGAAALLIDLHKIQDPGYRPRLEAAGLLIDLHKVQDRGYYLRMEAAGLFYWFAQNVGSWVSPKDGSCWTIDWFAQNAGSWVRYRVRLLNYWLICTKCRILGIAQGWELLDYNVRTRIENLAGTGDSLSKRKTLLIVSFYNRSFLQYKMTIL